MKFKNKSAADKVNLHAHTTPEAITVEEHLTEINIGKDGENPVNVYLPHPFSYLLLKLFAVRDCLGSTNPYKQTKAGYHATDLYRILASIVEEELATAESIKQNLAKGTAEQQSILKEAQNIVTTLFSEMDSGALLKMRQTFKDVHIDAEHFQRELMKLFFQETQGILNDS